MLKLTRDSYAPRATAGCLNIESTTAHDAVIYTYDTARGQLCAMGFHGKASKPDFHHSFRTVEQRKAHIDRYIESRKEFATYKAKNAAERKAPHSLKVGDILVCSWGYDQTNIDFYQVTRVPGAHTVEICKIAGDSGPEEGFMTAYTTAAKDHFIGQPMVKKCNSTNSVRIASYASASKWDGKKERYSWYA